MFRNSTKHKAEELGLKGWVKNLSNGDVEAVFEGPENAVKEMLEWCKKGPVLAKVDGVDVKYEEYKGEFDSFERL